MGRETNGRFEVRKVRTEGAPARACLPNIDLGVTDTIAIDTSCSVSDLIAFSMSREVEQMRAGGTDLDVLPLNDESECTCRASARETGKDRPSIVETPQAYNLLRC